MTIMEQYQNQVKEFDEQLEAGTLPLAKMHILQELKYRISVMQSLRAFSKLAPKTLDKQKISYHYQITRTYLLLLVGGHPLGPNVDEEGMQRRETAEESLLRVVEDGVRRYGMHGTSHKFVSIEMNKILGSTDTKLVTCHIGNGSSISAVMNGKCVDTTMGFTPLDGVEMGTRCGSIDPAIVPFLMKKYNIGVDEISDYLNKKCGFLGISEYSSDSRDIEAAIRGEFNEKLSTCPTTDEQKARVSKNSKLAAEILAYQVKKYIGSFAASMNGLDAVVFTAGMGENNPELRERACANMEYMGIKINKELNAKTLRQPNTVEISTPDSKVKVYVLPTNEELMIAFDTEKVVNSK